MSKVKFKWGRGYKTSFPANKPFKIFINKEHEILVTTYEKEMTSLKPNPLDIVPVPTGINFTPYMTDSDWLAEKYARNEAISKYEKEQAETKTEGETK